MYIDGYRNFGWEQDENFCYQAIVAKRTRTVNPLIEEKYDEAYEIFEKGSKLLGRNGGNDDEGSDL